MPKSFFVNFTGRAKVNSNTLMEYFGPDPTMKPVITVHEWSYLEDHLRTFYVLQNASESLDKALEIEYDQLDIEIFDKQ